NLSGLGFYIQSLGTSTTAINNFRIALGCASDSIMTAYKPTVEVRASSNITITNGWNYFVFDTPYYWDGTTVLIVETCLNNSNFTENAIMSLVNTSYTSCIYYRADVA